MTTEDEILTAAEMLRCGRSDDDVERATGASLLEIIGLRADAASAPQTRDLPGEQSWREGRKGPVRFQIAGG